MRTLDRWSALRATRPVAVERATIAGLALVVVVVSVWQFGLTLEGLFRGVSLGTWTAVGASTTRMGTTGTRVAERGLTEPRASPSPR